MLSSFEAENKVDANGESRYLEIHVGEADKALLTEYIKQAIHIIEERIARRVTSSTSDESTYKWVIGDTRWTGSTAFTNHVNEAIISYAMAAWLRGKLDDRVAFYETLFNGSLSLAIRNVFTKNEPS